MVKEGKRQAASSTQARGRFASSWQNLQSLPAQFPLIVASASDAEQTIRSSLDSFGFAAHKPYMTNPVFTMQFKHVSLQPPSFSSNGHFQIAVIWNRLLILQVKSWDQRIFSDVVAKSCAFFPNHNCRLVLILKPVGVFIAWLMMAQDEKACVYGQYDDRTKDLCKDVTCAQIASEVAAVAVLAIWDVLYSRRCDITCDKFSPFLSLSSYPLLCGVLGPPTAADTTSATMSERHQHEAVSLFRNNALQFVGCELLCSCLRVIIFAVNGLGPSSKFFKM
eukprot:g4544.t1